MLMQIKKNLGYDNGYSTNHVEGHERHIWNFDIPFNSINIEEPNIKLDKCHITYVLCSILT